MDLSCAVTATAHFAAAQQTDNIASTLLETCLHSKCTPQGQKWSEKPFKRYKQVWRQLKIIDGVL